MSVFIVCFYFREEEFLVEKDSFRRSAFMIIEEMVDLSSRHPAELVDEVCIAGTGNFSFWT